MERTPITPEGYEKIRAELEHLETVEMPKIAQRIADARAEGDLSENAEYHGQRENQGMLQAKIDMLKSKLANSYLIDKRSLPKDEVLFGSKLTLLDVEADEQELYELVGPGEEDYTGEVLKILCTSPLAQQLLHHKVGDEVDVDTPGGKVRYRILEIG